MITCSQLWSYTEGGKWVVKSIFFIFHFFLVLESKLNKKKLIGTVLEILEALQCSSLVYLGIFCYFTCTYHPKSNWVMLGLIHLFNIWKSRFLLDYFRDHSVSQQT